MSWQDGDEHLLGLTALITVAMQLSFFAVAAYFKFDKVTDFAGSTNFLVLSLVTVSLSEAYARQIVAAAFVCIWAVRLAGYLLYRIIRIGTDSRFDETREKFWAFLAFWVYQMVWVWTVHLPVTYLESESEKNPSFGTGADIAGIAMFVVGLAIETVADQQKFAFKQDTANKGHWCDAGLWRYSRHPNYFGEILLWWGIFTLCSSAFDAAGYATVVGPLFLTGILLFISGIPLLEKSADERYRTNAKYQEYKSATSVLVPLPQTLFVKFPTTIKAFFFCEWGMYSFMDAGSPTDESPFVEAP